MSRETDDIVSRLSTDFKESTPDDMNRPHSFSWYIEELLDNPNVARNAHQRLADMFDYYGSTYDEETGVMKYELASEDPLEDGENVFYGSNVHSAIHEFVNKVRSGSRGLGTEKRIKLLLGPVGSGKSDFDRQLRKYFEHYTRQESGKMYTFKWVGLTDVIQDQDPTDDTVMSQMNQDPLVLLPYEQRKQVLERINENLDSDYTIRNKQSLDPESEYYITKLLEYYDDDLEAVLENHIEVVRLVADENKRQCIETFEPKDKKNQDETELTGDVDYSKIAVYGENDPRSFDYAGAFCNSNRGIFSGEELLKLQREFLYDFLHATQEQTIKPKNNPRIDIDQVIVGRTNMPEYRDKKDDEKMEAFNDRTKRIDYPYVYEYDSEANVYEKILRNADLPNVHIEPHTLEVAALFTVLSRIKEPDSEEFSILQKAKAYNGETEAVDIDIDKLKDEADEQSGFDEGMDGISPRFVMDEIAEAIMDNLYQNKEYLSALSLFPYLEENLENHGSVPDENVSKYQTYLELAREEFDRRAIDDVRTALAYDTEEIEKQGEKYIDNVLAYVDDEKVEDELTGRMEEPDEQFMRAVEEKLNIPEDRISSFRQEITNWISRRAREGEPFKPQDNQRLQQALERKIWEDKKHNINFSALISSGESEDHPEWIESLISQGYSEEGAKKVLEYAGAEVAKEEEV